MAAWRGGGSLSRASRPASAGLTVAALLTVLTLARHDLACEGRSLKAGVSYSKCDLLSDIREIEDQCNHKIQPSAIAYLPTHKRLLVVGQEYILHYDEDSSGNFKTSGCYKGDDKTIGRGDIEGATGLDFALSEPPASSNPRWHANWKKLKALDSHIMVMEETYAYKGVYLVDTSKLGTGFVKSTEATVAKFPISNYPQKLEALAFVPNLDDDDYLGVLIMGTQRRVVATCRIPLGDWKKDVDCNSEISKFDMSLDSMEYDPTFKARPGRFGALMLGSDPMRLSVYVDPWAITRGEIVEWSAPFDMRGGVVDGTKIVGIEGSCIYGDRVFYAIDDNKPQGVLVCNIDNKPSSKAKKITGWHPFDIGSPDGPTGAEIEAQAANGKVETENIVVTVQSQPSDSSSSLPAVEFDILPTSEITGSYVIARWLWYDSYGDGICGSGCREEKDMMCLLYPDVCVHLRCREAGADHEACSSGGYGSLDAAKLAAMPHNKLLDTWTQAIQDGGWACNTDHCKQTKQVISMVHPVLGLQLRCEDLRLGRAADPEVTWADCQNVPPTEPLGLPGPFELTGEQLSNRWSSLNEAALKGTPMACGSECKVDKVSMCMGSLDTCQEMRCRDVKAGLVSSLAVDCVITKPATAMAPPPALASGYCTWVGSGCGGDESGVAWCTASAGNCAVGCGLQWCYWNAKYAPIKPTGSVFVTALPDEAEPTEAPKPAADPLPSSWLPNPVQTMLGQSTQPSSPTPLPPPAVVISPPAQPSLDPTPAAPIGYCSKGSCLGLPLGGDSCSSAVTCVFGCGGRWCYGEPLTSPSALPTTTGILDAAVQTLPASGLAKSTPPVFTIGVPVSGGAKEADAEESAPEGGAGPAETATEEEETVISVPEVMKRLDLNEDKAHVLIDILLDIPNVLVEGKVAQIEG